MESKGKSKDKKRRFSLKNKLILVTTAFVLFVLGISTFFETYYFIARYREKVENNIFIRQLRLKDTIEDIFSLGLGLGELKGVDEECKKIIESIPFGTYCFITDDKGKIHYSSSKSLKGKVYNDKVTQLTLKGKNRLVQEYKTQKRKGIYDFSMPLYDYKHKFIGTIRVGVLSEIIYKEINTIIMRSVSIGIIFIVVVMFGISMLHKVMIISPISRIIEGLNRFSHGNLSYRIECRSNDEFEELSEYLNSMAEYLSLYQKEIVASKQYADSIIENMAGPVVIIDKEKIIERVNNATLSILGYGREELFGAHISMIMKENVFTAGVMESLTKDGYIKGIDAEYVKKNGESIPFSLFTSFLWVEEKQDNKDRDFRIVIVARDKSSKSSNS